MNRAEAAQGKNSWKVALHSDRRAGLRVSAEGLACLIDWFLQLPVAEIRVHIRVRPPTDREIAVGTVQVRRVREVATTTAGVRGNLPRPCQSRVKTQRWKYPNILKQVGFREVVLLP